MKSTIDRFGLRCLYCLACTLIAIASACSTDKGNSIVDTRVVIVDIRDANRAALATLVANLRRCNPRIVGFDVVFSANEVSPYDTSLIGAMKEVGKVVALDVMDDQPGLQNNITAAADKIAYSIWYTENHQVYCPLALNENNEVYESLALALVADSTELMVNFIKAGGNVMRPIRPEDIYQENYAVVDIDSVNAYCSVFSKKIVLIGTLQEDDLEVDGKKTFRPFLTASSVSYMLDYESRRNNVDAQP